MEKQQFIDDFYTAVNAPIGDRKTMCAASGNMIGSTKTLANLDSLGQGCAAQVRLGKRVGYQTRPFAIWLFNRIKEA